MPRPKKPKSTPFEALTKPGETATKARRVLRSKLRDDETVAVDKTLLAAMPKRMRHSIDQCKKALGAHKLESIRVRLPKRTMARLTFLDGDIYRVTSTSARANDDVNVLRVYRNGDPVVVLIHHKRDPLGYIKKHPGSKYVGLWASEIMGACGLTRAEAESILFAPMRAF